MKRLTFTLSLMAMLLFGHSCSGKKAAELPPLEDGQVVCYENDSFRLIDQETSDTFYIRVQPKQKDGVAFQTPENTLLEAIAGNFLVVSEGMGNNRTLIIYDLQTGEECAKIENFFSGIAPEVEGESAITFFIQEENGTYMVWNSSTEEWEPNRELIEAMQNPTLEEAKRSCQDFLSEGVSISALQKYRIDLSDRSVTPLNEYRWSYTE
ncbi:MAG: hypothetical protein Q3998_05230 [Porphyromonas sp.]|nr:hypothetical protein [Porphyromonas sp.]